MNFTGVVAPLRGANSIGEVNKAMLAWKRSMTTHLLRLKTASFYLGDVARRPAYILRPCRQCGSAEISNNAFMKQVITEIV